MCAALNCGVGGRDGQNLNFGNSTTMQNCDTATCARWRGMYISTGIASHDVSCCTRASGDATEVQQLENVISPNLKFDILCSSVLTT